MEESPIVRVQSVHSPGLPGIHGLAAFKDMEFTTAAKWCFFRFFFTYNIIISFLSGCPSAKRLEYVVSSDEIVVSVV